MVGNDVNRKGHFEPQLIRYQIKLPQRGWIQSQAWLQFKDESVSEYDTPRTGDGDAEIMTWTKKRFQAILWDININP
jgi:hypothetical protein